MSSPPSAPDEPEDARDEADRTPPPPRPSGSKAAAGATAIVVTAITAAAMGYAFRPEHAGQRTMLGTLALCYGALALGTVAWLFRRGLLKERLAPRRGDVSFGFLLAAALYILALLVRKAVAPTGGDYEGWVMRIYLQLGDPRFTGTFAVGTAVLLIAAAEEITWRGLVMERLVEAFGGTAGWLAATFLYALVHLPTVFLLADPIVGPNPLLLLAAGGCGLIWGYLAMRIERLGPSLFAHALFTWGVVEYPIWRM